MYSHSHGSLPILVQDREAKTVYCSAKRTVYCLSPRSALSAIGLFGSTVPMDFAVSGVPSPFLLLSLISWIGMECLVGVLDKPACLFEMSPGLSDFGLAVLA